MQNKQYPSSVTGYKNNKRLLSGIDVLNITDDNPIQLTPQLEQNKGLSNSKEAWFQRHSKTSSTSRNNQYSLTDKYNNFNPFFKDQQRILSQRFSNSLEQKFHQSSLTVPNKDEHELASPRRTFSQKKQRIVYIQTKDKRLLKIKLPLGEEEVLTSGWLLSEAIRKIKSNCQIIGGTASAQKEEEEEEDIIALRTAEKDYFADYLLQRYHHSLDFVQDRQLLVPVLLKKKYKLDSDKKATPKHFKILRQIGTGGFSKVYLVKSKYDQKFYAMKVVNKRRQLQNSSTLDVVMNERNIMARLDDDFLIHLHWTFQTATQLFLVMEYAHGGDLYRLRERHGCLTEEHARFYFGQIILGLSNLHARNIIYRDLKLENVLLDDEGNIKLADFGLSRISTSPLALQHTICGSMQYMAPEMLQNQSYHFTLDYYALGILLYELIAGVPPFQINSMQEIVTKVIKRTEIKFPAKFSSDLKDLITRLLEKNPRCRLGAQGGIEEIISHAWCKTIDFRKLQKKFISAPFQMPVFPDLQHVIFSEQQDQNEEIQQDQKVQNITTLLKNQLEVCDTLQAPQLNGFSFYGNPGSFIEQEDTTIQKKLLFDDQKNPDQPEIQAIQLNIPDSWQLNNTSVNIQPEIQKQQQQKILAKEYIQRHRNIIKWNYIQPKILIDEEDNNELEFINCETTVND